VRGSNVSTRLNVVAPEEMLRGYVMASEVNQGSFEEKRFF
jgi:hypothetical protein